MDFLSKFPDKFFDLIIDDPPYGIGEDGEKNGTRSKIAISKSYICYSGNDKDAPPKEYFQELIRVSKKQIIWGANHFISRIPFDSSCWIVWDKDNGMNDFADCELAWTSFPTAVRKFKYRWHGMLQENMKNKKYAFTLIRNLLRCMDGCLIIMRIPGIRLEVLTWVVRAIGLLPINLGLISGDAIRINTTLKRVTFVFVKSVSEKQKRVKALWFRPAYFNSNRNMNIHQTVPRSDCTSFAKCGKHSLAYCRKYGASECGPCEIVKRKPRNRVMVDGVERKVCSRCKRLLLLSCFYDRTIYRNRKAYHIKTSWCKMCVSEDNMERNKRKKSN